METELRLSNQAMGAMMMALQESLMNQLDIVPILKGFKPILKLKLEKNDINQINHIFMRQTEQVLPSQIKVLGFN